MKYWLVEVRTGKHGRLYGFENDGSLSKAEAKQFALRDSEESGYGSIHIVGGVYELELPDPHRVIEEGE